MVTVLNNQSLFDIALQTSGQLEAVAELAQLNDLSVTGDLTAGIALTKSQVINADIVNYYTTRKITPCTALAMDEYLFDHEEFSDEFE